jgi:hypothetical protein
MAKRASGRTWRSAVAITCALLWRMRRSFSSAGSARNSSACTGDHSRSRSH